MSKILQRGSLPPVPPAVEDALLRHAGIDVELRGVGLAGMRPTHTLSPDELSSSLGWCIDDTVDVDLPLDSEEERLALKHLNDAPSVIHYVFPQAPLEALVIGRGGVSAPGSRRIDFVYCPPDGSPPVAIEVDGAQHLGDGVDDERDALLGSAGVTVERWRAEDVRQRRVPAALVGLRLENAGRPHPLIHGPVAVHRLFLALLDGVRRGFLAGTTWVARVEDRTGYGSIGLPGYLSLLAAVAELWGNEVAPDVVELEAAGRRQAWVRRGFDYTEATPTNAPVDCIVHLDVGSGPLHVLPPRGNVPQIVVRDAHLPVKVAWENPDVTARITPELSDPDPRVAGSWRGCS